MVEFINQNNLLIDRQSGFRSQLSYLTALTHVIKNINSLDVGRITFLVLLDHSKTFDTVHYSIYASNYLERLTSLQLLTDNNASPLRVTRIVPQASYWDK